MKAIKDNFSEIFTLLAWVTLLAYVVYCTITNNKTDSVRDAWNILILIAGFVWGKGHSKTPDNDVGSTTAQINATITTDNEKT